MQDEILKFSTKILKEIIRQEIYKIEKEVKVNRRLIYDLMSFNLKKTLEAKVDQSVYCILGRIIKEKLSLFSGSIT